MYDLCLFHGDTLIRRVTPLTPCLIGREDACDLQFSAEDVSRRHCEITWDRQRLCFTLTDHHSANGTYVNAEPLYPGTTVRLSDGDSLQVGKVSLRCERCQPLPCRGECPRPDVP
jgi:pSer/pThr/pTyr-binding forkhead associated (FHA) protein